MVKKLEIFQESAVKEVRHAFTANIIGGELKYPEDEIMDVRWFTFEEIKKMKDKLRSGWVIGAISVLEKK